MDSFKVVKFILCIITIIFLGNSAAMNQPSQPTRMKPEQQYTSSEKSSTIVKRHSWSGSRKINVCEEDENCITQSSATASNICPLDKELAERQNFVSSLIAGVGSGSLASIVCAPLDLLRTRMQVAGGLEKGVTNPKIIKSMYEIYASDGIRGCFRGLGATLATVPAFWGLYFPMYESLKRQFMELSSSYGDGGHNHHALVHLSSAMCAGAVADIVCNPMFVVRTRMQTEALHYFQVPAAERKPHGVVTTIIGLHKEGGVPIFWRGLTASLLGLFHVGIQFPVYERLKAEARNRSPGKEESALDLLLASGLSKMTAATLTYPHEVIRSRMMDARGANAGKNVYDTARYIIKNEGYGGLYTGLRVSLLRVVPNCCVTFVSYELIARWVRNEMGKKEPSHRHMEDNR
jgi:solute carrier family 25 folate transporter 32